MQYSAPVDFTMLALTSPVYAPLALSAQFSAATLITLSFTNSDTLAK
jgi:hypothetical protein